MQLGSKVLVHVKGVVVDVQLMALVPIGISSCKVQFTEAEDSLSDSHDIVGQLSNEFSCLYARSILHQWEAMRDIHREHRHRLLGTRL